MRRAAGVLLLACAACLAALPTFDWFSVTTPGGRLAASGLAVSGVLWLVPLLSLAIAVAGAALVAAGHDRSGPVMRRAGPVALVASLLALAAALWAAFDPELVLVVAGENVAGPVAVPVEREPASWLTPGSAMIAAAISLAISVRAWRP